MGNYLQRAAAVVRGEADGLVSLRRAGEWVSVIDHRQGPEEGGVRLHIAQWHDILNPPAPTPSEEEVEAATAEAAIERLPRTLEDVHENCVVEL